MDGAEKTKGLWKRPGDNGKSDHVDRGTTEYIFYYMDSVSSGVGNTYPKGTTVLDLKQVPTGVGIH